MKTLRILVVFVFSLFVYSSVAQNCQICTYTINSIDTSAYMLDSGKTLCIESSGIVMGKIQLAGGVICNGGTFSPSVFNYTNGDFENYGIFYYPNNILLKGNSHFINHQGGELLKSDIHTSEQAVFSDETIPIDQ